MQIEKEVYFICPVTKKHFKTENEAKLSAEKALAKKEQEKFTESLQKVSEEEFLKKADWVRLNVENVSDIPALIKQKGKEFWDLDFDIKLSYLHFGEKSNSHSAPIGKKTNWSRSANEPTTYLGWSGRVVGTVNGYKAENSSNVSVANIVFARYGNVGFRGFYCGSGSSGEVNGGCVLDMDILFFLDDFPKLKEKYNKFVLVKEEVDLYNEGLDESRIKSNNFAFLRNDVVELDRKIDELSATKLKLVEKYSKEFFDKNKPEIPKISKKTLDNLNENFPGSNNHLHINKTNI